VGSDASSAARIFGFRLSQSFWFWPLPPVFGWRFAASERAQQTWVVHTYGVIDAARSVLADLSTAEAVSASYVISGQDNELATERTAVGKLRATSRPCGRAPSTIRSSRTVLGGSSRPSRNASPHWSRGSRPINGVVCRRRRGHPERPRREPDDRGSAR